MPLSRNVYRCVSNAAVKSQTSKQNMETSSIEATQLDSYKHANITKKFGIGIEKGIGSGRQRLN